MRLRSTSLAAALLALGLSGCASAGPTGAPSSSVPGSDQWVAAAVDVWFENDSARICRHDIDPGFTMGLPRCDEALDITGITPDDLRAQLAAQGMPVRTEDAVDVVPAFVVGTLSGRSFELESLDYELYAPTSTTSAPDPVPSFATGEEKDAYVSAQPFPQPAGCTAPAGGWSSMSTLGTGAAAEYQRAHPDVLLGNGQTFVDNDTAIVLLAVAADADPEQVAADLAGAYPGALCVRQSALTATDLREVEEDPVFAPSDTVLSSSLWQPTDGFSDDPEPVFTVLTTVLTDALVERAAEHPDGLVRLVPWFEPVTARS
ncbi:MULTISPECIES: hypothetical protein [unclassified Rathayibacter]|uniref:hypothetical protein n=1 Tax=unclassified Rathayibacter TaxID=2609250 RepID=UPI0006FEDF90|nr:MULTISPECIES: hypothetical protein [unclassified Rathayibacter]KQQ00722.1 hypothetical protein ASF42_15450 [Rathayibacter sp. Leaf294]KQS10922.1 hypothetical protein ASG06_15450 [Rathayibacter sp. Leaf185]